MPSEFTPLSKLKMVLEMIRFSHTIFALPFALLSMLWASGGRPGTRTVILILLAMVSARSAAMAFNRIADLRFDRENPRTSRWPLAAGKLGLPFAWSFVAAMLAAFAAAAWALNPLCLALSPIAAIVVMGYSLTKRFTWLCHYFLGLALGIAPAGAWVAVRGGVGAPALWLSGAVMLWVAGFDILYSIQDADFDRRVKLHSIPSRFGVKAALWVSGLSHLATVILFLMAGVSAGRGALYYSGVALATASLAYEHAIIKPSDLSRLNAAFFTLNGWVSVLLLLFGSLDIYLPLYP